MKLTDMENAFEDWRSLHPSHSSADGFKAGWLEACRRSAKAAWEAETHYDAVESINKIAEAIVWEP